MIIFTNSEELTNFINNARLEKKQIGFVPTMGALHLGHVTLIQQSKQNNDITVCSIFVNPAQFNDAKDFENYPKTTDQDIEMLTNAHCDVLFLPSVAEIYPANQQQTLAYDLGNLELSFDGAYRPGHFQGVCKVVHRLLDIIPCDKLYLGQKDYQQCMVINRLLNLTNKNIEIVICPTVREANGLAMSSRNKRLSATELENASAIFASMQFLKQHLTTLNVLQLKQSAQIALTNEGFKLDYFEVVDATTLAIIDNWNGTDKIVCLVAAFLGPVRLIDNLALN
jgi:pantoate--beta-alanine ligase